MVSLSSLPEDVLLLIFENVPAYDLILRVAPTCSLFYGIITDERFWSVRKKRLKLNIPWNTHESYDDQKTVCESEKEMERWSHFDKEKLYEVDAHFSTVNAVRLFDSNGRRLCLSGGRDRKIRLWDMHFLRENPRDRGYQSAEGGKLVRDIDTAHVGWVWQLTRPNNEKEFLSAGWDNRVKQWKITPSSIECICSADLRSAVVGLDWLPSGEGVCSTFLHRVCIVDPRASLSVVQEQSVHAKPVVGVCAKGDLVYSWSDDAVIMACDRRASPFKPVAKLKLPSLSYAHQVQAEECFLAAGTNAGDVVYMDSKNLTVLSSFSVAAHRLGASMPFDPIRAVAASSGRILTLSKRGIMDVFSLGKSPRALASHSFSCESSRVDAFQGDICVALSDGRVVYWSEDN